MEEFDLFSALTDVSDRYVLEILETQTRSDERKSIRRIIVIAAVIVLLAVAGTIMQRFRLHNEDRANNELLPEGRLTLEESTVPVRKMTSCEEYQFLFLQERLYVASLEKCDAVGNEIGCFSARNDLTKSEVTQFKDVTVCEIFGVDSSVAVAVRFPDETKFYVYYSAE